MTSVFQSSGRSGAHAADIYLQHSKRPARERTTAATQCITNEADAIRRRALSDGCLLHDAADQIVQQHERENPCARPARFWPIPSRCQCPFQIAEIRPRPAIGWPWGVQSSSWAGYCPLSSSVVTIHVPLLGCLRNPPRLRRRREICRSRQHLDGKGFSIARR